MKDTVIVEKMLRHRRKLLKKLSNECGKKKFEYIIILNYIDSILKGEEEKF